MNSAPPRRQGLLGWITSRSQSRSSTVRDGRDSALEAMGCGVDLQISMYYYTLYVYIYIYIYILDMSLPPHAALPPISDSVESKNIRHSKPQKKIEIQFITILRLF